MDRAQLTELLQSTGCAEQHGGFTFLRDPHWGATELRQFRSLLNSKIENRPARRRLGEGGNSKISTGWLCVPTGGTSGGVRFARHDQRTLTAAVEEFCAHFGLKRVNAVGVLPAYHVSGLMARVRSAATGGEHVAWDWKRLSQGDRPALGRDSGGWVISLVPTQLQRLLASRGAVNWLRRFEVIFVGGGPVWPELADRAAAARLRVSLSYGMTETAAMVTAQRPAEFLAGDRSSGSALPHAKVTIGANGLIRVAGASVFRGYFPRVQTARTFVTEDLGRIDAKGRLHVLGRRDAVIITGGKKVQPLEVEAALRATGAFKDVAVVGVPHLEWGQEVIACHPSGRKPEPSRLTAALAGLAAFKRPKRYVALAAWPRNAQGKINRAAIAAAAAGRKPKAAAV